MKRPLLFLVIGFAGLLASCGSSVSSSSQPAPTEVLSMSVSTTHLALYPGGTAPITATVLRSVNNQPAAAVNPQPVIEFIPTPSDAGVSVSPFGVVCAGKRDPVLQTCTPTLPLPGVVNILVNAPKFGVSAVVSVSVHAKVTAITLTAPNWLGRKCISQTNPANVTDTTANHVQYVATAVDANDNVIPSCDNPSPTLGCIRNDDFAWTTADHNVAEVTALGDVQTRNPGVTNVYASLPELQSSLAFITCPPKSIVLSLSPPQIIDSGLSGPFTIEDLSLNPFEQKFVHATLMDVNGNALNSATLTYIFSDPLSAKLDPPFSPFSSTLTANSPGRFTLMAACVPPSCNPSVADFVAPLPLGAQTAQGTGFGYPIYSNLIGATITGTADSVVLVTGTTFADGSAANELLVFSSGSMTLTHQPVVLVNTPNSLVVAPNGAKAYLGSSAGLMVLDLSSFQSSTDFKVANALPNTVITGTVLGVSPDSRHVLVSDTSNPDPSKHLVFLIDTGTKTATEFQIPHITSATFAADDSNIWIGGDAGVYVLKGNAFIPIPINPNNPSQVTSMAWMPDGQSFFASGDHLTAYRTCENQFLQNFGTVSTVPEGLVTTTLPGIGPGVPSEVPHLLGLDNTDWFDIAQTSSAQVVNPQTPAEALSDLPTNGNGDVCLSTISINPLPNVPSGLGCALPNAARQISFSPKLQQAFITGVDASCGDLPNAPESTIHGYDALTGSVVSPPLTTTAPVVPLSGSILKDGSKLFFGSFDGTNGLLHRIDLSSRAEDLPPVVVTAIPGGLSLKPTFVAVVPK